jgi:hypothetical protein
MNKDEAFRLECIRIRLEQDVELWPDLPERNDPCLCGSGKKYKRCCQPLLEKEEAEYNLGNV